MTNLKILMVQSDYLVGDVFGNAQKIITALQAAKDTYHSDLVIFPELALSGYPLEDLLYRPDLHKCIQTALTDILEASQGINVILGLPWQENGHYYNQAIVIESGKITHRYVKQKLPNYSVFDEVRYFVSGDSPTVVELCGIKIGITICEDLWFSQPAVQAKAAGAELLVSINASPFAKNKSAHRAHVIAERAWETHLPIVYVNTVGAQDELVFDGGSMVIDEAGKVVYRGDFFKEGLYLVEIKKKNSTISIVSPTPLGSVPNEEALIYAALVTGVRDYLRKNQFSRAVIGLSGGVDSALTLAIAVDAIGKDNVEAVMMPSRYTTELSLREAEAQAKILGVNYEVLSIEPVFNAFLQTLAPTFRDMPVDATEENLQARCRGTLLMAISNKKNAIVLATGNKSEMAVGYATLYGDMVGGFCVLKDVFKTLVYRLCHWRNEQSAVIPQIVIDRPPSAELAENQKDQDVLPPYGMLDDILERYVEHDQSLETILAAGYNEELVRKVIKMVDRNEYKRRQAAPGVRITERAFGKDRRFPITSGFLV